MPYPIGSFTFSNERADGQELEMDFIRESPQESSSSRHTPEEGQEGTVQDNVNKGAAPRKDGVKRALKGYHVFFISVSGIIGVGLYVRSANMLRVGGPAAVIIPFGILGFLAYMIMQCISEMLLIWPVSGALRLFVQKFVDKELGIAVGVAYYFAYALAFAALISATAGEASVWTNVSDNKALQAGVFYFVCTVALLLLNFCKVRRYGILEVFVGSFKLLFIAIVVVAMGAINGGAGKCPQLGAETWSQSTTFFSHDDNQSNGWGQSFFIALQTAAFAFVGIEIPAVLAVEADILQHSKPQESPQESSQESKRAEDTNLSLPAKALWWVLGESEDSRGPANGVLKFSATRLPIIVTVVYFVAGMLVSFNVGADDPSLPANTWSSADQSCNASSPTLRTTLCSDVVCTKSNSGFVISAHNAQIKGLPATITIFLILTALGSANTTLYVASRTLYDLGRMVDGRKSTWHRWFSKFSEVNSNQVPQNALLATAVFGVIPYLSLNRSNSIAELLYILAEMASEFCVIVWTCECYAFIRFHHYIHLEENKAAIDTGGQATRYLRRKDAYPYKSQWPQPLSAWIAIALCATILIVASGASLWNRKGALFTKAVAAYLAPVVFVAFWMVLKVCNRSLDSKKRFCFKPEVKFIAAVKQLNKARDTSRTT